MKSGTLGFVMLCHTALDRAAQVARHWAERDCPVVSHVDKRVKRRAHDGLVKALGDLKNVRFSGRHARPVCSRRIPYRPRST